MNLREFLGTIRLYWRTFLATALIVLAMGAAWLLLAPLKYVSTAQLLVSVNGTTTANAYQNMDVVSSRVSSYVPLLTSDVVSQRVVDKLGLAMSPAELAAKVSVVQVPPSTAVINIAVRDRSPEQARRIADTLADEFVAYTAALETPTGADAQKVQTSVVSSASQPRFKWPELIGLAGLIIILAAVVGAASVWIRSATDRVVRTPTQAAAAAGVPVVAVVGLAAADSLEALEPYRLLRATVTRTGGTVVAISPTDVDIDSALIAVNLGRSAVLAGSRCVVVDATGRGNPDARNLRVGTGGQPDLVAATQWATGEVGVAASVPRALARLKSEYQHIIIATAPVLSGPGVSVIDEHADAVVLVVELAQSRRAAVRRAAAGLVGVGAQVVGVLALS